MRASDHGWMERQHTEVAVLFHGPVRQGSAGRLSGMLTAAHTDGAVKTKAALPLR